MPDLKQITAEFEQALSPVELASPLVRSRVASAVLLAAMQEQLRCEISEGLPVDPSEVCRVADQLERVLQSLPAHA
jgi:hypothetical protein